MFKKLGFETATYPPRQRPLRPKKSWGGWFLGWTQQEPS